MKKIVTIIFVSLIFSNQSYAVTLKQAMNKAYKNNPILNAAREDIKISKENKDLVNVKMDIKRLFKLD